MVCACSPARNLASLLRLRFLERLYLEGGLVLGMGEALHHRLRSVLSESFDQKANGHIPASRRNVFASGHHLVVLLENLQRDLDGDARKVGHFR